MNRTTHTFVALLFLLAVVTAAGCGGGGPEKADVHGKVTLDGEPLVNALVTFQPEGEGSPSYARTDKDGYYELKYTLESEGAILGKHRVTVSTLFEDRDENDRPIKTPERCPDEYCKEGVIKEVKRGDNTIDLPITGAVQ